MKSSARHWLDSKRRSGKFQPDLDNGSVGGIDGIGHVVKRVFDNALSLAILSAKPARFAELLLNYRLQVKLCGCN